VVDDYILKALTKGVNTIFKVEGVGSFSLEAHPGNSELVFRDEQRQMVPSAALKQRITDNKLQQNSGQPVIKKLKTKRSLDQSSSLGL